MKFKIICFDLDNTLCRTPGNSYNLSKPIKKNIKLVNLLYKKGYYIKIFTARFMGRSNQNKILAQKKANSMTINQLKKWKVNYHEVIFGKPSYDIFVDDKSLFYKNDWIKLIKRKLKI